MRKQLTFLLICCSFLANAQQVWTEKWRVSIEADDVWDIDQAGNVYLVHQQSFLLNTILIASRFLLQNRMYYL